MTAIKNPDSTEFVTKMLTLASNNQVPVERGKSSPETKGTYHIIIKDPSTGRIAVAVGNDYSGDDFDWGFEIDPASIDMYL